MPTPQSPSAHLPNDSVDPSVPYPHTLSVEEAASLFDVSRSAAYRATSLWLNGDKAHWPTRVFRVGGRQRIPTADVLAVLGLDRLPGYLPVTVEAPQDAHLGQAA